MKGPIFIRYGAYLMLLKLMNKFNMPFADRMSMVEFEFYEQKMQRSISEKSNPKYLKDI